MSVKSKNDIQTYLKDINALCLQTGMLLPHAAKGRANTMLDRKSRRELNFSRNDSKHPKTERSGWTTERIYVWLSLIRFLDRQAVRFVRFIRFIRFKKLDCFSYKGGHK